MRGKSNAVSAPAAELFPDAIGVPDCLGLVLSQIDETKLVLERLSAIRDKLESMSASGLLFHAKLSHSKTIYLGLDLTLKL